MPSPAGLVVLHNDLSAAADRRAAARGTTIAPGRPVMFTMGIEEIFLVCRDL
jgi:hypothetical protein